MLISGCDTGFGRLFAVQLAKDGYSVLAGCLTDAGAKALKEEAPAVDTIILDITKEQDIKNAAKAVEARGGHLHALINNAGINQGLLVEWTTMEQYRRVMEVNYFGHVAMTKAVLPFLGNSHLDHPTSKRRARIVNIISASGFLAAPGMSAYTASKHAMEGWSTALRREYLEWGVHVAIVEPGFMRTPLVLNCHNEAGRIWDTLPAEVQDRFGRDYFDYEHGKVADIIKAAEDPIKVVRDVQHAVSSTQPNICYTPGIATVLKRVIWLLPDAWLDYGFLRLGINHPKRKVPNSLQQRLKQDAEAATRVTAK